MYWKDITTYYIQYNTALIPDEQNIRLTHVLVSHGPTEVLLPVLYVSFLIKDLDEVKVAVIGLLQAVLWELDVDLLPLLGPDNPGAVQRCPPLLGVGLLLLGNIGRAWNTHRSTHPLS